MLMYVNANVIEHVDEDVFVVVNADVNEMCMQMKM